MAAPSYLPEWATEDTTLPATGKTNKVRPKESLRTIGWDKGQIPSAEEFNWLFNNMYLWLTYFSEEITTFLPITGTSLSFTGSITGTATWNGDKTTSVDLVSDLDNSTSANVALTLVKRDSTGSVGLKNLIADGYGSFGGAVGAASLSIDGSGSFGGSVGAHGLSSNNGLDVSSGTSTLAVVDINAGAIDNTAIGNTTASSGKFTTISATGLSTLSTVDINSGYIDGVTIGASNAAPATVSTFTANNAVTLVGGVTSTGTNTWSGSNTFSGTTTHSGTTNFSGGISSTGTNTFSGSNTFSSKLSLQSSSIGTNGYTYLPNGMIEQWGTATVSDDGYVTVTLPFPFPNACFNVQATPAYNGAITGSQSLAAHAYVISNSQIGVGITNPYSSAVTQSGAYWRAIGY